MCYAKPGPRCTPHARTALAEAKAQYNADPSDENLRKMNKASREYDSTRGGQKELKQQINATYPATVETPDARTRSGVRRYTPRATAAQLLQRDVLSARLEAGRQEREDAMNAYRDAKTVRDADAAGAPTPIIVPRSPYSEPQDTDLQYCGLDIEGESDGYYDYDENGNALYDSATITSVDMRSSIASVMRCRSEEVSPELMDYGQQIGLDNQDSYYAEVQSGYYGSELYGGMNPDKVQKLKEWYYSQNNARDNYGVMDYCRSKGQDTSGLNPVEAIKTQLTNENNGRRSTLVDRCDTVMVNSVPLSRIRVPHPTRMEQVEEREIQGTAASQDIAGVVVHTGRNEFTLVDGYHRTKGLKSAGKSKGQYVILSQTPPSQARSWNGTGSAGTPGWTSPPQSNSPF